MLCVGLVPRYEHLDYIVLALVDDGLEADLVSRKKIGGYYSVSVGGKTDDIVACAARAVCLVCLGGIPFLGIGFGDVKLKAVCNVLPCVACNIGIDRCVGNVSENVEALVIPEHLEV